MISPNAREGFERLLVQNVQNSFAVAPDDRCEVTAIADLAGVKETRMVVLTVSSYVFRLVVLIYFTSDEATREHFARANKIQASELTEQVFLDAISECGNMCCGGINRELARFYPHIGMSTPNILAKECSTYLKSLDCSLMQHFKVIVNDAAHFHVSLCVSDFADLDFTVSEIETGPEEANSGELEMF